MADQKLSALTELAATPADTDEVYIRDVSEPAATESKRITVANLKAALTSVEGLAGLLSADQHVLDAEVIAAAIDKTIQTTKGDLVVVTGASPPVRLGVGANDTLLTADSAQASGVKWAAAAGGATKEFFVLMDEIDQVPTNKGEFRAGSLLATNATGLASFKIPGDFSSITNAEIIVIPSTTNGTINWDILSDYAASGEAYTTHSESDTASTYNVTSSQIFSIDISGILASLAADDYVGIMLKTVTAGCFVIGIRFKYS